MDRDTAIAKIKKCLALGKSSEPHEAAAALRQAQKLMQEHGISDMDVQLSDIEEERAMPLPSATVQAWQARLAHLVAETFGAETYVSTTRRMGPRYRPVSESCMVFVAPSPWSEVARYAFETLLRQCAKARMQHIGQQPKACKPITKTARGDAFALGWVSGVRGLVERLAPNAQHEALLLQYMQARHPEMGTAKVSRRDVGRNVKDDSYYSGAVAGSKATLNHALSAGEPQRRLA